VASRPGGAMLNTAVSLGRLGHTVDLISETGQDQIGDMIIDFLKRNAVNSEYIYRFPSGNTAIALAFLDAENNASYSFYKNYPRKRLGINYPDFRANDILLFGSFFAITKEVRKPLLKLLDLARSKGMIIIYDPNFRKSSLGSLPSVKNYIMENISFADIIRGSDEDFKFIFNSDSASQTHDILVKHNCENLIYTRGAKNVVVKTTRFSVNIQVSDIHPVSTIGAGDTFNAGLIHSLLKNKIEYCDIRNMITDQWREVASAATDFATNVCLGYDNYISTEFAENYS